MTGTRHAKTGWMLKADDATMVNEGEYIGRLINSMTSFDELSVASHTSQFDLKSTYPISAIRDKTVVENDGTVAQSVGEFVISTSTNAASTAIFRSVERGRYVAGFDAVPGMGIRVITPPTGNQEIEWGCTDFTNGYAVGIDADGMFTRLYSGGTVVSERRREDWINPATAILDPEKVTIYRMPFRWYGSGPYQLMVTQVDQFGRGTMLHVDTTEGTGDAPVTQDPNQPLAVRARNLGTAAACSVALMGRQFHVAGQSNPTRRVIGDYRLSQSVGTTFVPLIAFRQKNGIYATISTKLAGAEIQTDTDLLWQIRVFPTLTGGTWVNPPFTESGVETALEFNVSATAIEGGIQVWPGGLVSAGGGNRSGLVATDLPSLDLPSEVSGDIVCLCARSISGTATVSSVFRAREDW